jgi:hypothetical protein
VASIDQLDAKLSHEDESEMNEALSIEHHSVHPVKSDSATFEIPEKENASPIP